MLNKRSQEETYGIPFIIGLFCAYSNLEYVRVPVIHRINQAEYVIHVCVAASQEYVNTYSTRRAGTLRGQSRIRYSLHPLDSVNPGFIWQAPLVNPLDSFGFTYREDSYNVPKRI